MGHPVYGFLDHCGSVLGTFFLPDGATCVISLCLGQDLLCIPPLLVPKVEVGEARLEVCQVHHLLDAVVQRLGRPLQRAVVEEDEKVEENLNLINEIIISIS